MTRPKPTTPPEATTRPPRPTPPATAGTDPPAKTPRRYGGLTPEQRQAERRRRLLDAALHLFGTHGFAAVGINRLCSEAGVTARHFYEEFPTREDLFGALYDREIADVFERVAAAVETAPTDHIGFTEALLGAYVHSMIDDPRRARVCCLELNGINDAMRAKAGEIFDVFASLIYEQAKQLKAAGQPVNAQPSEFIPNFMVGGTNEAVIAWLRRDDPPPASVLIEELARVYVFIGRMPYRADYRRLRAAERTP